MNRSYIGRLVGTLVVAAGLLLGLLSGTSSAQVIDSAPRFQAEQVRAQGSASSYGAQGSASSYGVQAPGSASSYAAAASSYYKCGYYRNWGEAYYTHCGNSAFPDIRVQFNYGMAHRTIRVYGTTNLSRHPSLQIGGVITGAWCVQSCW